jgi:23S rRNA (cytidine1920-2'-O)/16S rRNA (cytidine1409-2'-O)-methyltransferase
MDTRVRLDTTLVERGLCTSRTEAQECIKQGAVLVGGVVCYKPAQKVDKETSISVTSKRSFVSRGGEKLRGCLLDVYLGEKEAKEAIFGAVVLDVGSSTGGFTDYVLQCGAAHVDCVDVGTNQLHGTLRNDTRVSIFENQDIRTFETTKQYDIIVVDVSFISLKDIVSALVAVGTKRKTKYFVLIKPQFEVGRGNTKKGIVKDEALVKEILEIIIDVFVLHGLHEVKVMPSHLQGGDGNQEYFLYGTL